MLSLIWNKEKAIHDELHRAYNILYFNDKEFSAKQIAQNLINLMNQ